MPIAGFDPSVTHFGWVILDEHEGGKNALLDHGTFKTTPADGLLVQRLITQRERIRKLLADWDISFVSMEAPILDDYSTEMLFALNQFMHEVFLNAKTFVVYIQPFNLKKIVWPDLPPLEVTKHHVVHMAKTELDLHGKVFSEHCSDAYFIAKIGRRFYQWFIERSIKDEDLTPEEHHLFCHKHTFKRGKRKGMTEYKGLIYKENEQFFDYRHKRKRTKDLVKEIKNG